MLNTLARWLALAATSAATLAAQAQTSPPVGRPDPLDAQATVPALVYRSSLTRQHSAKDDESVSWRQANDTVKSPIHEGAARFGVALASRSDVLPQPKEPQ